MFNSDLMTDEELKEKWKDPANGDEVLLNEDKLTEELDSRLKKFEQIIRRRNAREITVAFLLMPFMITAAWFMHPVLAKMGAVLLSLFCIVVVIVLRKVAKMRPEDLSLSIIQYLVVYKQYLEKERSLLSNVLYWYIGPSISGISLIFIGFHRYVPLTIGLLLGVLVNYINRRAVKNYLTPLIDKVSTGIDYLTTNE